MPLGHEIAGRIAALGDGVRADYLGNPVAVGDRVISTGGAPAGVPCGRCYYCAVVGTPVRCVGGRAVPNADTPPHLFGGFATHLYLSVPHAPFFRTRLAPEIAMCLEPLTIAIHALDHAGVRIGDVVAVLGVGAIGLMCIAGARMSGAARVIALGAPTARLDLARDLGADECIDIGAAPDPEKRIRLVREKTPGGYGADVVFECAGSVGAVKEGLACVRDSGCFVEMGHFVDLGQQVTVNPAADLVRRNLRLAAPFGSTVSHYVRGLRVLEGRDLPFERLLTHRVALGRIGEVIQALRGSYRLDEREVIKAAVSPAASLGR